MVKRESSFDLLRIISSIAVIFIHVSSSHVDWLVGSRVNNMTIVYSGGGYLPSYLIRSHGSLYRAS